METSTVHRVINAKGDIVDAHDTLKAARDAANDRRGKHTTKTVKLGTRTLYDIVEKQRGEIVGTHEDLGVAEMEAQRLDVEAAAGELRDKPDAARGPMPHMHLDQVLKHEVVPRQVSASDDPDDGTYNLTGPMVSSEPVTARSLKRGERPPEQLWTPS